MTPRDDARRARHRIPAQRQSGVEPELPPHDPELDAYLAALAPEAAAAGPATGRFGSSQVFSLRLPALRMEQLRRLAASRGVSPGALAVDWVLERLDQEVQRELTPFDEQVQLLCTIPGIGQRSAEVVISKYSSWE